MDEFAWPPRQFAQWQLHGSRARYRDQRTRAPALHASLRQAGATVVLIERNPHLQSAARATFGPRNFLPFDWYGPCNLVVQDHLLHDLNGQRERRRTVS